MDVVSALMISLASKTLLHAIHGNFVLGEEWCTDTRRLSCVWVWHQVHIHIAHFIILSQSNEYTLYERQRHYMMLFVCAWVNKWQNELHCGFLGRSAHEHTQETEEKKCRVRRKEKLVIYLWLCGKIVAANASVEKIFFCIIFSSVWTNQFSR